VPRRGALTAYGAGSLIPDQPAPMTGPLTIVPLQHDSFDVILFPIFIYTAIVTVGVLVCFVAKKFRPHTRSLIENRISAPRPTQRFCRRT
jgi:hypothetical protein